MAETYDAIIIGTGQAGPPLAQRLTQSGMKVAIIERKFFGGTCVNTGCIPTKAMVASAYAARLAARAAEYGVAIAGQVTTDMHQVKARKDAISGKHRQGVEDWVRGMANCTVIHGQARFESPHELSVQHRRLTSDRIFINVGGRAIIPDMPGLSEVPYLTNSTMMDVDYLPRHLIIVGGSYIGLEFGQMFRRFGSDVTIIEAGPRLVRREDEDISQAIKKILENEGIHILLNASCITAERESDGVAVGIDCQNGPPRIHGSHLLLAVGRQPNTDDLSLDRAGIAHDKHGYIQVDDQLCTNVPGIWALGDCNGKGAFTHTSYNDFEIVAANLLDHDHRCVSDRITAYALYIDPPLGRAGLTETQVRESHRPALIARMPMTRVGRAQEKGETQGFMKVLVDAQSKQILGASLLGTGCDEVIHDILDQMYAKAPYTVMQRAMHIHPTVSELLPTLLEGLQPLNSSEYSL